MEHHIKHDFYLPVAYCTKEDVPQNPSCHEADMLNRDFPVVLANQVPLQWKTKKYIDTDKNKTQY